MEQFLNPTGVFWNSFQSNIVFDPAFLFAAFFSLDLAGFSVVCSRLGSGDIALLLAKRVLNAMTTGVVFSLVYLFYPPVQGFNWFFFMLFYGAVRYGSGLNFSFRSYGATAKKKWFK